MCSTPGSGTMSISLCIDTTKTFEKPSGEAKQLFAYFHISRTSYKNRKTSDCVVNHMILDYAKVWRHRASRRRVTLSFGPWHGEFGAERSSITEMGYAWRKLSGTLDKWWLGKGFYLVTLESVIFGPSKQTGISEPKKRWNVIVLARGILAKHIKCLLKKKYHLP